MAIVVKLKNKNTSGKSYEMTSNDNTIHFDKVEHGTYQVEVINNGVSRYIEDLVVDGAENITVQGQTHIFINDSELLENYLSKDSDFGGGINLLTNSSEEFRLSGFTQAIPMSNNMKKIIEGKYVTVTADMKKEADTPNIVPQVFYRREIGDYLPFVDEKHNRTVTEEWERYEFLLPPANDLMTYNDLVFRKTTDTGAFRLKNIKVEIGEVATPYSLSQDDLLSDINNLKQAVRDLGGTI